MDYDYYIWKREEPHEFLLRLFNFKKPGEPPTLISEETFICEVNEIIEKIESSFQQQYYEEGNRYCKVLLTFTNCKGERVTRSYNRLTVWHLYQMYII